MTRIGPTRRGMLVGITLVLLLVFVLPLVRLRSRRFQQSVADAIQRSLGRAVAVGPVGLQLFPLPGLIFSNFVVQDDAAFSAEPMLRADEVIVQPRLNSLWRRRLEIGSLSLQNVSLNLVRTPEGRWNLESVLTRATHTPAAPTTKARPESRPRFPYIEASHARINFKAGQEKTIYAFADSDLALWLESEDVWNMRLAGRVVRTDANLSDTGRVQISGSFRRTDPLRSTPLNVQLVVDRAQLGQLTQLIYGRDRGWRGSVHLNAMLSGRLDALGITGDLAISDFRRYDILSKDNLRINARCSARYQLDERSFNDIRCRIPQREGEVAVAGSIAGIPGSKSFDVSVTAHDVPVAEFMRFSRHAKRGLPEDLEASGKINAAFTLRTTGQQSSMASAWMGGGSAEMLSLRSKSLLRPLDIGTVTFALGEPSAASTRGGKQVAGANPRPSPVKPLNIGPFSIRLGSSNPTVVKAGFTRSEYTADIHGEADMRPLVALVRSLGGRAPGMDVSGTANIDLSVSGKWSGFAAPISVGNLQLRNVFAQVRGLNAPLHIRSAKVLLSPDEVDVEDVTASLTGSHTKWAGSFSFPRDCSHASCSVHLDVHADDVSSDDLNLLLNPRSRKHAWYEVVSADRGSLAGIHAEGRVSADRLTIKRLLARNARSRIELAEGKLRFTGLQAGIFGGTVEGDWIADLTGDSPVYSGNGTVEQAAVANLAALMHGDWASGNISGSYRFTASGWSEAELLASAAATFDFTWTDGTLHHVTLDPTGTPLRVKRFMAQAEWRDGKLELTRGKMETPDGIYQISGTAGRQLNLKLLSRKAHAYAVSGTLEKPRVTLLSGAEIQAALKP